MAAGYSFLGYFIYYFFSPFLGLSYFLPLGYSFLGLSYFLPLGYSFLGSSFLPLGYYFLGSSFLGYSFFGSYFLGGGGEGAALGGIAVLLLFYHN
jgi:hypothetical protein